MKRKRKQLTTLDYFRNNIKWFMMVVAVIFIAGIFVGPGFGSYGNLQCGGKTSPASKQEYLEQTSTVMAKLGDKEFKEYNINRAVTEQLDSYRRSNPSGFIPPEQIVGLTWTILDRQVTEALKLQKAKEADIKVEASEVNEQYENEKKSMIDRMGLFPASSEGNESLLQKADKSVQIKKAERAFLSQLASVNMTPDSLKDMIRENLLAQKYDEKLTNDATEEVNEEARKQAVDIVNRIVAGGEDFGEVAKEVSQEPSTASKGGLVENATRKDAKNKSDEYATLLFTSEIGKVSEPQKESNGYYIVKVISRTLADGPDYEAAKPGIIQTIKDELGIKDEEETAPEEVKKYTEEELIQMAEEKGVDEIDTGVKKADEIAEEMIKERFETVTYRQIFIQPFSAGMRKNDNLEAMKKAASIEIFDPMMKAYSYVNPEVDDKDFDSAIEAFKVIKQTRITELVDLEKALAEKEAIADKTSEDKIATALDEVSWATQNVTYGKENIAEINYLISYYMDEKIKDINQKRTQDFLDKQSENPDVYAGQPVPDASAEEMAMFDAMHKEMLELMIEAVGVFETPNPFYSALYGDLLLLEKNWEKAHEQWALVADYGSRDPNLLQRADSAYNQFMDNLSEESRLKAGNEYNKLQIDLNKALEVQQKQQEEWQARMQQMIEEQMAQENE